MPTLGRIRASIILGLILLVCFAPARGQEESKIDTWFGRLADGTTITDEQLSKIIQEATERLERAAADALTGATKLAGMTGADLHNADLTRVDLNGADLRKADLSVANLSEAQLKGADLRGANLIQSDLRGADLEEALLEWADLREANLEKSNLKGYLYKADLRGVSLREADLRGADLMEADLSGTDLTDADLEKADLQGAYLWKAQGLTLPQISEVKTLYRANLDRELREQIEKSFPHLLQKSIE